jgi:glycosyltransferase involved in cell wall biosynthesis
MRWLMITRKLDPADDHVGFVLRWIEALAARIDHLDVICQEHANPVLPGNVTIYSMGKESGAGRIVQARRFMQVLRALTPQVDGVFCHMIPRYVLFAAPWTRIYHKPLFFWYTHRAASVELRMAGRLATHILTASPGSFPLRTGKLAVMGHGVETDLFLPPQDENIPPEIVMVGRLAQIKRQNVLLRATSQVVTRGDIGPFRVLIAGGPVENEPNYPAQLRDLVQKLDPIPDVTFTGPLPHTEVARMLRGCAVVINLSPPGLFDKAALEGMLAGKPTIVTNTDFLPLLGEAADLLYLPDFDSAGDLAGYLARLLRLTPDERHQIGVGLRERTIQAHSLDGLMDRIVQLMREANRHG